MEPDGAVEHAQSGCGVPSLAVDDGEELDAAASAMLFARTRQFAAAAPGSAGRRRLTMEERRVVLTEPRPSASDVATTSLSATRATLEVTHAEDDRVAVALPTRLAQASSFCVQEETSACKANLHRGMRFGRLVDGERLGALRRWPSSRLVLGLLAMVLLLLVVALMLSPPPPTTPPIATGDGPSTIDAAHTAAA